MQITVKHKTALLMDSLHEALRMENGWVKCLTWSLPSSIQIAPGETASIISVNNTVRIEHGYDFEDKVLS